MKGKKGQTGGMIGLAVGAIILVIVLIVIANFASDQTSEMSNDGRNITIASATGTLPESGTGFTLTDFYNSTQRFTPVIGDDVNISDTGTITVNSSFVNGFYSANYTYLPTGYITSSLGRTMIRNLGLLLAVAILLFIASFGILKK